MNKPKPKSDSGKGSHWRNMDFDAYRTNFDSIFKKQPDIIRPLRVSASLETHDYGCDIQGNIYSFKHNKVSKLKPFKTRTGYLLVRLHINKQAYTPQVHRLILLTFNYREGCQQLCVNHIDSNRANNAIANLEWVTYKQNSDHCHVMGRVRKPGPCIRLEVTMYDHVVEFTSLLQFARAIHRSSSHLSTYLRVGFTPDGWELKRIKLDKYRDNYDNIFRKDKKPLTTESEEAKSDEEVTNNKQQKEN